MFLTTRDILAGEWRVPQIVNVASSLLGTVLIAAHAWRRRAPWGARQFDHGDRLVAIFAATAAANAAISYGYTKDVIMSPAGAFFALALAVAVREALNGAAWGRPARAAVLVVLLIATSSLWAWRALGIHAGLRHSGIVMRNEWAYADQWFARERQSEMTPAETRLKQYLQDDAVIRHPAPPRLNGDWLEWFEE